MKKNISKFWVGFKKDFDIYINLFVAIPTAIFSIFQISNQNIILSLLLTTTSLISLSLLKNRQTNRKYQGFISEIGNDNSLTNHVLKQNFNQTEITDLVMSSSHCFISGLGLTILFPTLNALIEKNIENCPKIKFLLMDPNANAVKIAAFRAKIPVSELTNELTSNINKLENLTKKSCGRIQYKTIDYLPHCNLFGFNTNLPHGRIIVHFASWRTSHLERPFIELEKGRDSKWFDYYNNQFYMMWEASGLSGNGATVVKRK